MTCILYYNKQSKIDFKTTVIRDGLKRDIDNATIVVGDVVYLSSGDKVPADVFLFSSLNLKISMAHLIGDDQPQSCSVENTEKNPIQATNICFSGSLVTSG